ncbi:hypothetical protein [Zhihengliuella halotolerans]|uniref:hypothetical protein n=1 Tax=Zhihengliuella halotolerans TaxID=370736 RepID=UPI000C80B2C0|nr:hypothetical protein [Zhihengliuella halotolerans]
MGSMIQDSAGNDLRISQKLYDSLVTENMALIEVLQGEKLGFGETLAAVIKSQQQTTAACVSAVATLESYVRSLQTAADIPQVGYNPIDVKFEQD